MKIKHFWLPLLALLILGLNSCKKETVDVTHLLTTVPSSASGVVVMNLEGLLEDANCKIKDHAIIPGEEMKEFLAKAKEGDRKDIMVLFNGETGIEPKAALIFYDSNRAFLTFSLYDVDKFCKFVEGNTGVPFSNESAGVRVNGNVAVKDAQAWVCLTGGKRIDADAIAAYSTLKDSQSFLVTPMGEKLLVEEDDIRGWGLLNTFMNEMLSRSDRSMMTLGLGFLFNDAESVRFKVDFKKGGLEAETILLNDKFKPAKCELPSDKVDVNTLKSLGSTCDGMMAFTLNSKLIKKFEQIGSMFGGSLFGEIGDSFKNIDGTVGIIASTENGEESYNGVITTKGDVQPSLRDWVSRILGPVSQDGKLLRFSKGDVKGALQVSECAEELKGSSLGIVVDAGGLSTMTGNSAAPSGFKELVMKFKPESGGLELELDIKTKDPKENAFLTFIKGTNI